MVKALAIVFCILSFAGLQAHNLIAHVHHEEEYTHDAKHHGDDNPAHHHHEHDQTSDGHSPDFGKYLDHKRDDGKFTVDQLYIILNSTYAAHPTIPDVSVPLSHSSSHEAIPQKLILTALAFRGPPSATKL